MAVAAAASTRFEFQDPGRRREGKALREEFLPKLRRRQPRSLARRLGNDARSRISNGDSGSGGGKRGDGGLSGGSGGGHWRISNGDGGGRGLSGGLSLMIFMRIRGDRR